MSELGKTFTIPSLRKNMRNSENVNKASHGVEVDAGYGDQVSETIEKLTSPITSIPQAEPLLIPIHENDFDLNFKSVLSTTLNPDKKTLILLSRSFVVKSIYLLLLRSYPEIKPENILKHDRHPNNASTKELQNFLTEPKMKIGIFQSHFVTGIEGSNVIYFLDSSEDVNTSVRCTMTRAVTNLTIIFKFENNPNFIKFKNTKLNNSFIKCKRWMTKNEYGNTCLTCNTNKDLFNFCVACSIGCHHEHKIKWLGHRFEENEECDCIKLNCLIQKFQVANENQSNTSKENCLIS